MKKIGLLIISLVLLANTTACSHATPTIRGTDAVFTEQPAESTAPATPTPSPAPDAVGEPVDFIDTHFASNAEGLFYCETEQSGIYILKDNEAYASQYCVAGAPDLLRTTAQGVFFLADALPSRGLYKAEKETPMLLSQGQINWFDFNPVNNHLLVCVDGSELVTSKEYTEVPTQLYKGILNIIGFQSNKLILTDGGKLLSLDLSKDKPSPVTLVDNGVVDVFINGDNIYYTTETDTNILQWKADNSVVLCALPQLQFTMLDNQVYTLTKTNDGVWLNKNNKGYLFLPGVKEAGTPYFLKDKVYLFVNCDDYSGLISVDGAGKITRNCQSEG